MFHILSLCKTHFKNYLYLYQHRTCKLTKKCSCWEDYKKKKEKSYKLYNFTLLCNAREMILKSKTEENTKGFIYSKKILKILQRGIYCMIFSVQFNSVTHSCLTLCNPMDCSTPVIPVHHPLPELTQTHVH